MQKRELYLGWEQKRKESCEEEIPKYFGIPTKHEIVLIGGRKQSLKGAKAALYRVHFLNSFVILRQ